MRTELVSCRSLSAQEYSKEVCFKRHKILLNPDIAEILKYICIYLNQSLGSRRYLLNFNIVLNLFGIDEMCFFLCLLFGHQQKPKEIGFEIRGAAGYQIMNSLITISLDWFIDLKCFDTKTIRLMEEILHPVDMVNIPLFTRFYTSQVVQDFFHQQ